MPIVGRMKGDLVALVQTGLFDGLIHGANCFCFMNSGIAKQIKEAFPQAYEADCKTKKGDFSKLGTYSCAKISGFLGDSFPHHNQVVYNLYTQFDYGYDGNCRLDYTALRLGFEKLNNNLFDSSGWTTRKRQLAIPKIGCGLAGGDWSRVQSIINECTPNLNLYYIEYEKL